MLSALFASLEDVYTTVRMENAAPQGKKPTVRNVEKLISWYKGEYLGRFLRNAEKIVQKFVRLVRRGAKSSLARVMREMYGDSFTLNFDSKEIEETIRLIIGEFNPFGLTEREMLVKALNHQGIETDKESVPELYAMLKVCNSQTKVDNGFDYGTGGSDEIEINI